MGRLLLFRFLACCVWPAAVLASSVKHHGSSESENAEHVAHDYETLYLVFAALLVGTAVLHLASSIHALRALPVTVVFFILGIILALLVEGGVFSNCGIVLRSYESWAAIDPHLLLFTFLPPLLFGDAMGIDTHVARRTSGQCLILAGPGVLIGAFSTAAVLHYVLPYGWDFATSLMVGSILAATDPVAVVSLLKDLGASPVLTMQIQGESLLNDGTAMVLFTVAYGMVEGRDCDFGCITGFLFKSVVGASILGAVLGWLFYLWIRKANNSLNHTSVIIQISLTVTCAYWSFMMAEGILHISGVLSTVAAALVLARKMWPVLVERKAMREFWHVIETFGNTLVFFLAGLLTGRAIPLHRDALEDAMWAFVVYVAVTIIRFLMLLILRPILNRCGQGHRVTMKDIIIMTWGGLRGMVGLALAILVDRDRAAGALSEKDGQRVLFLVGGVAALTLVVNATTAGKLCDLLGLSATPEGRMVLVTKVARSAEAHVNAELQRLLEDKAASRACMLTSVCESVQHLHEKVRRSFPVDGTGTHFPIDAKEGRFWTPRGHLPPPAAAQREGRVFGRSGSQETQCTQQTQRSKGSMMHSVVSRIRRGGAPPLDIEELWAQFYEKRDLVRSWSSNFAAFKFGGQLPAIRRVLETEVIDPGQLQIVREVFLEIVRARYWDQLQEGRFLNGSREPRILINSVSLAKEMCGSKLGDWEVLERDLELRDIREVEACQKKRLAASARGPAFDVRQSALGDAREWRIVRQFCEKDTLRKHLRQQQRAIQVCSAFIDAHRVAQAQIASYFGDKARRFTDSAEEACVVLESQTEVFAAASALAGISKPVRKRMSTVSEVRRLCDQYRRFVLDAHEGGVLQSKEAEALMEPVAEVLLELRRSRKQMSSDLASECCAGSGIEHMLHVAAALEIQRAWRDRRMQRRLRLSVAHACDSPRLGLAGASMAIAKRARSRSPSAFSSPVVSSENPDTWELQNPHGEMIHDEMAIPIKDHGGIRVPAVSQQPSHWRQNGIADVSTIPPCPRAESLASTYRPGSP